MKNIKKQLQNALHQETEPGKQEETIRLCRQITRELQCSQEEQRTDFWRYLSDVFRFEGMGIVGLQIVTLLLICVMTSAAGGALQCIPAFTPLFALAVMPPLFRSQYYGVGEIEAVTRASGAQLVLAKLILAMAANLVCITVLLSLEVYRNNAYQNIGQMVLYCLVPYLVCMSVMLRLARLCRRENVIFYITIVLSLCVCWGISAAVTPWLYETSATGFWVAAFVVFTVFFIREIYYIITMRKEGKIYGAVN